MTEKAETKSTTAPSSKSQQSDANAGAGGGTGPEEAQKDAVKQSEEVAKKGGSKKESVEVNGEKRDVYELPEGYDPLNDPVVPSSDVAQTISVELRGLGESPTLQALHDAKKDAESNK